MIAGSSQGNICFSPPLPRPLRRRFALRQARLRSLAQPRQAEKPCQIPERRTDVCRAVRPGRGVEIRGTALLNKGTSAVRTLTSPPMTMSQRAANVPDESGCVSVTPWINFLTIMMKTPVSSKLSASDTMATVTIGPPIPKLRLRTRTPAPTSPRGHMPIATASRCFQ